MPRQLLRRFLSLWTLSDLGVTLSSLYLGEDYSQMIIWALYQDLRNLDMHIICQ